MSIGKTGIVAVCTALARVLGFVRVSLIGFLFGATGAADVLNLVFQIPNNLRRLLAEGALSSAFIPVLSRTLSQSASATAAGGCTLLATARARLFFQSMLGFQLVLLIPLLLTATLFSTPLTALLFDFQHADQIAAAALLFRLLIWYILPISIAAICMAILNTHNHFTIPALSPLISSVMVIAVTLAFHAAIGIYAVGIGILSGGIMQVVMHIPHLYRYRYRLLPLLRCRNPDMRYALRRWALIISSALLLFANQQVAIYFASGLAVGSGSAMIYALTFWQLPFGILGISVITVFYPQMSALHARGAMVELHQIVQSGCRYLVYLLLPATIFLLFCADDIIFVALQRGRFTAADTLRTAAVLRAYSVGLLGVALFQYLQRFYYAIHTVSVTIKVLAGVVIVDVALSLWLKETRLGVSGLGWANSIAFWFGAAILSVRRARLAVAWRRSSPTAPNASGRAAAHLPLRFMLALAISVVVPLGYKYFWPLGSVLPFAARLALLVACACVYAAVVLCLYRICGVEPHPATLLGRRGPARSPGGNTSDISQ